MTTTNAMAPPINEALAQLYRAQVYRAIELSHCPTNDRNASLQEANAICEGLITDASVDDVCRAGAHYILSYSAKDYVKHAQDAMEIMLNLTKDSTASPQQAARYEILLKGARNALAEAELHQKYKGRQYKRSTKLNKQERKFTRSLDARVGEAEEGKKPPTWRQRLIQDVVKTWAEIAHGEEDNTD